MRPLTFLILITTPAISYSTISAHQDDTYSLGVGLGPRYLTAAHFNKQNELVPVVRIAGSSTYRAYVADTLSSEGRRKQRRGNWVIQDGDLLVPAPPDTHDPERARSVFTEALTSLKKAAAEVLVDQRITLGAVSAPQYFNDSSKAAVMDALQDVEPRMRQRWQVITSLQAMRLAYGLDSCEGFGLDARICDIDDGTHYILVVEYEESFLQLYILDVGADTVGVMGCSRLDNLGEAFAQRSGEEAHYRRIHDVLRNFIVNNNLGPHQKDEDFLQAVVISGEASEIALQHLRRTIQETLEGQGKDGKIRDSIDPIWVPAFGAAYQAMLWDKKPELLNDIVDTNFIPVDKGHDEL